MIHLPRQDLAGRSKEILLHHQKISAMIHFSCLPDLEELLSLPVDSFLRTQQMVGLITPGLFAIPLIGLFCFFKTKDMPPSPPPPSTPLWTSY